MKKTLLTLAAIGALAVPFGVAVAQDDSDEPAEPVPTTNEPDQVRDQERQQDQDRECVCDGAGPQIHQQRQIHEESCEGTMNREREQNRLEEGIGDGRQARQREQNRLDENTETGAPADAPAPWNLDGAQLRFRYGNHAGREGR